MLTGVLTDLLWTIEKAELRVPRLQKQDCVLTALHPIRSETAVPGTSIHYSAQSGVSCL